MLPEVKFNTVEESVFFCYTERMQQHSKGKITLEENKLHDREIDARDVLEICNRSKHVN
jgi:hypothetical protein